MQATNHTVTPPTTTHAHTHTYTHKHTHTDTTCGDIFLPCTTLSKIHSKRSVSEKSEIVFKKINFSLIFTLQNSIFLFCINALAINPPPHKNFKSRNSAWVSGRVGDLRVTKKSFWQLFYHFWSETKQFGCFLGFFITFHTKMTTKSRSDPVV